MNTVTYLPKCGNAHNAAATIILALKGAHPPSTAIVPFLENTCNKQPLTSLNKVRSKVVVVPYYYTTCV
jgi:hypothetical protein